MKIKLDARWLASGLLGLLLVMGSRAAPGGNIDSLKSLQLDTALIENGVIQFRIVAPADATLRAEGRRVQEALRSVCGVEPRMVEPNGVTDADVRSFNLILLGNFSNNGVIAKLYARHLCFTDAFYPGKGGYEVRTIHNPMGWGRNCVLLGGSDAAGVRAATGKFLDLLKATGVVTRNDNGKTVKLGRLHAAVSSIHPEQAMTDDVVRSRTSAARKALDTGLVRSQMGGRGGVLEAGMCYYLTGEEGWGRIFRDALLHYYELAQPTNDWALLELSNDPGGQYFWPWKLAMMWDNIEEAPIFSAEDRLKITNLLLNITRWVASCEHFYLDQPKGALYGKPGELRQGHPSYAALSLFFGAEYFRMYYPAIHDFEPRYTDIARLFDSQLLSYKSSDNATVYSPLSPGQYYCYRMTRGELDARAADNLKTFASYVVVTTDNRADVVSYGDTNTYIMGHPRGLGFLSKAAWQFDDAGLRWAFDWMAARSYNAPARNEFPLGDPWYEGLYCTDGRREEPSALRGVVPIMVDQGLYDYMRRKIRGVDDRPSPPLENCFDKLSMRRNFAAADEYLLLSGLSGVLYHGHEDGNSVLRLTWKDRVWLANMGYRGAAPSEHNTLMVRRNGQSQAMPAFVSLDSRTELPASGFTRTSVRDYNGVDWSRNIFWRKGEYFLFLDEASTRQPGDYQLQLIWRVLGDAKLAGDELTITQDGETFAIVNGDRSRKALSLKRPDKNSNWTHYDHADGIVRILTETRDLKAGGSHVYANLLHPGEPARFTMERVSERAVRVRAGRESWELAGLAGEGNDCGNFKIRASAYRIGRDSLAVFDARAVSLAGLELQSDKPVSFELNWATAQGDYSAAQAVDLRINATSAWLDGKPISAITKEGQVSFTLPAGQHALKFGGLRLLPLGAALDGVSVARPEPVAQPRQAGRTLARAWQFKASGHLKTLATGDLTGDGSSTIVVAAGDQAHAVSADGRELWTYRADAPITCLHLRDVNRDGKMDVMVGAGSTVFLLDGMGKERWRYDCAYMTSPLSAITTADLEGDGRIEILAGNELSVVFAINADGTPRWKSFKDIGPNGVRAFLAEDLDGDGKSEIVVGSSRDHGTVMLTHDGTRSRWRVTGTHQVARSMPLDASSGRKLLMIGGPNGRGPARIMEPATGRTRKLLTVPDDLVDILPVDFDGDGAEEFVTIYAATGLYVYTSEGDLRGHVSFDSFASALAVADFDRDGRPDIAIGAPDGKVWITDGKGAIKAAADGASPVVTLAIAVGAAAPGLVVGRDDGTVSLFHFE